MAFITSIFGCLGLKSDHDYMMKSDARFHDYTDEKVVRFAPYYDHNDPDIHQFATQFVHVLLQIEEINNNTRTRLRKLFLDHTATHGDEAHTDNWYESLASAILEHLEAALRTGAELSATVRDAVERADLAAQAVGFVKEHPIYCTLIAIGVLVIIAPWVLEVLGFAETGIVEGKTQYALAYIEKQEDLNTHTNDHGKVTDTKIVGSWAALWQSRYAGFVPKGSLFSMLQRLGMTWTH